MSRCSRSAPESAATSLMPCAAAGAAATSMSAAAAQWRMANGELRMGSFFKRLVSESAVLTSSIRHPTFAMLLVVSTGRDERSLLERFEVALVGLVHARLESALGECLGEPLAHLRRLVRI